MRGGRPEESEAAPIIPALAGLTEQIVAEIEAYGPRLVEACSSPEGLPESTLDLFDYGYTDLEAFQQALEDYQRKTGCGANLLIAFLFALSAAAAACSTLA